MILLSFTVRNHKSVRDEVTVDLTRPSLRTLSPRDGDWSAVTYPIAGIFGGNATGKSALLDALRYMFTAIAESSTTWQGLNAMLRAPFGLDGTERTSSSVYELDFVHDGHRHLYGFEVDREGIKGEWLRDVPGSRWRTLLDRDRESGTMKLHQSLGSRLEVTRRELVLSRALLLNTSRLHHLARDLANSFDCVLVKDSHREQRLQGIADALAEGSVTFDDIVALLQVADIGITSIGVEEAELPPHVRRAFRHFQREVNAEGEDSSAASIGESDKAGDADLDEGDLAQVIRRLTFTHRGSTQEPPAFSIHDESDGTIAWLAVAVPALEALRNGGLLLVDEIDASLHPHLMDVLLGAFADPVVNTRQAQLIFTSHESYVLSPLSEVDLESEQVWLTDKTRDGVTELTCLADFPKHRDANVAKRYLTGRYGGTPRLSPSMLDALVGTARG